MSKRITCWLVDSSIWIPALNPNPPSEIKQRLTELIAEEMVATTDLIMLEILRGASSKALFEEMYTDLKVLKHYSLSDDDWHSAKHLAFELNRKGVVVPTVDLLIAQIAISNDLTLWHADRHFELIKGLYPELETDYSQPR